MKLLDRKPQRRRIGYQIVAWVVTGMLLVNIMGIPAATAHALETDILFEADRIIENGSKTPEQESDAHFEVEDKNSPNEQFEFLPQNSMQDELQLDQTVQTTGDFEFQLINDNSEVVITGYTGTDEHVVIPEEIDHKPVVRIGNSAFSNKGLSSVAIPGGVREIGSLAFYQNQLAELILPDSISVIGAVAFQNNSLTEIIIPAGVTQINGNAFANNAITTVRLEAPLSQVGSSGYGGIFSGNSIIHVSYGDGITRIPDQFFRNADLSEADAEMIIPEGIQIIGGSAFFNSNLSSIEIPSSVTEIGSLAFYQNQLTELILPDSVSVIGTAAFQNNSLTEIIIPAGVTQINGNAFANNAITNVRLEAPLSQVGSSSYGGIFSGNSIVHVSYGDGITRIPDQFFRNADLSGADASILIPDGIQMIGSSAFSNSGLSSVEIPTSVTEIGSLAFSQNQLTELFLPDSVNVIGSLAFSENQLSQIDLSENISVLPLSVFANNQLTTVSLPHQITQIGNSAFQDNALTHVEIGADVTIDHGTSAMGSNAGFRAAYLINESAAGIYEFIDGIWSYQGSPIPDPDPEQPPVTGPVAVINMDNMLAAPGMPIFFDGSYSRSSTSIVSYAWNLGDGTTHTDQSVTHQYAEPGFYTVTLTVTDSTGKQSAASQQIQVIDLLEDDRYSLITIRTLDSLTTNAVPEVEVHIYDQAMTYLSTVVTGTDGMVQVVLEKDKYLFGALKDQFIPRTVSTLIADSQQEVTIPISQVEVVAGELTSRQLSLAEIEHAGIDTGNPDNQQVYEFSVTLEFIAGPDGVVIPIKLFKNSEGEILRTDDTRFYSGNFAKQANPGEAGGYSSPFRVFPISEKFYLVIYGEAKWLKEMFQVELIVVNHSQLEIIENSSFTLGLPEGLSLADMISVPQESVINAGLIFPGETKRTSWFVRGDEEGDYHLSALVSGQYASSGIDPSPFSLLFETPEPITVLAGDALHLIITAPSAAYKDEDYTVNFKLVNVSDRPVNNLTFSLTKAEQYKVLIYADHESPPIYYTIDELTENNHIWIQQLKPGHYFEMELTTDIWFASILEATSVDIRYYLTDKFITSLEGSTTSIPTTINVAPVPFPTLIQRLFGYGKDFAIDYAVDVAISKIPYANYMYKGSKVLYATKNNFSTGNANITISIISRGFHPVSTNSTADPGQVNIWTDSDTEIRIDENTIQVSEDALLTIEGVAEGYVEVLIEFNDEDNTQYLIPVEINDSILTQWPPLIPAGVEKPWTVVFSQEVHPGSAEHHLYVVPAEASTRLEGVLPQVNPDNPREVILHPPAGGWIPGEYYLYVTPQLLSAEGVSLSKGIRSVFTIE